MKGNAKKLIQYLDGADKRFIIPVYQRNYDWKPENCAQLYMDLVSTIKDGKPSHFFGSIVSYCQSMDEIILIDGQQRITTVSLILIAMVNAMKKGLCVSENPQLCQMIWETFIINKFQQSDKKVRLKPFRNDSDAFDRLIFKDESEYLPNSHVTRNYRYFYDKIVNAKDLTLDELYVAIKRLEVIDIELELHHGDNPQLIFESLNSTGLDLKESDKIRNYVLMNLDSRTQEEYYDKYWNKIESYCRHELDGFMRNFLTVKTGLIPNLNAIYASFKTYAKEESGIEEILKEMLKYAEAYDKIVSSKVGNAAANEISKRLNKLDMTVAYPFIMALLVYNQTAQLDDKEIERTLSCIETYIFRRFICGWATNALNKIFATLHKSVMKYKTSDNSYADIVICLLESRKSSGAFPTDADFSDAFVTRNVYSMNSKNKMYIFERLENESSVEKNDIYDIIENGILTIEHIMPQTLSSSWKETLGDNWAEIHEIWKHRIANLTLTGYNTKYSNRTFQEKKTIERGFEQSGLRLNQEIARCDKWTQEELEQRSNRLLKLALKIWPYPATDFMIPVNEGDVTVLSEDNFVNTGKKILWCEFQGERVNVIDWVEMMLAILGRLYEINPDILFREAEGTNVWFSTDSKNTSYNQKIADGLYFCSSSSTANKMSILKNLFELYGIDEEELRFGLRPEKNEE